MHSVTRRLNVFQKMVTIAKVRVHQVFSLWYNNHIASNCFDPFQSINLMCVRFFLIQNDIVPFCLSIGRNVIIHWNIFHIDQIVRLPIDVDCLFRIHNASRGSYLWNRNKHTDFVPQMVWRWTCVVCIDF